MKVVKYFQVSTIQLFLMALVIGVISASLIVINMAVKEYLQLPKVIKAVDGSCAAVSNFRNGDAYTCADVDVILRKYRIAKQE